MFSEFMLVVATSATICAVDVPPEEPQLCEVVQRVFVERDLNFITCPMMKVKALKIDGVDEATCTKLDETSEKE